MQEKSTLSEWPKVDGHDRKWTPRAILKNSILFP